MANLSEDIQCASSDTQPPMLDRTDFASWQQRTRLYCQGKENGVNILKSIDEGPFQMGTFRETLAEGTEGGPHLGLPKDIYSLINHYTDAKDIWDNVKMLLEGSELTKEDRKSQLVDRIEVRGTMHGVEVQLVMGEHRTKFEMLIQVKQGRLSATTATENGVALDEEQLLFLVGGQDNDIDEDMDEQPVQDLALNVDNVFQADDFDAFDSDVDEAPTAQTMFMANLSFAYPVYDEAGPSYDSDILSEYVKDNAVPVVQSNVYSVPNDAYMMIFNDMHEMHAQSVFDTTRNTVVDNSLTPKLATYKEQVELYERRARFKLTEREQKIDEQLRIVITDRNIKEEKLKKELHSVKMQLASTINHNKSMLEEVSFKKGFFTEKKQLP
ncbi:hypothetical protein Tco_1415293 [Tanacetum coccineum]